MFPASVEHAPSPQKLAGAVRRSGSDWDWRDIPFAGDTDAWTARQARRRRTAERLTKAQVWKEGLARLPHYKADYPYDPVHEYERDWTTDPDYAVGIKFLDYDKDGFLTPDTAFHVPLMSDLSMTLCDGYGNRATHNLELRYEEQIARTLGRLTADQKPKTQVEPDLAVLADAYTLPEGVVRGNSTRVLDLTAGDPLPDLVVEIVSSSSEDRDYEDKMALYAALGIPEYLIIEPGEPADGIDEGSLGYLLLYRLDGGSGTYEPVSNIDDPYIEASDLRLRMIHVGPSAVPLVQWWDPDQSRWRDRAGDRELVAKEQGIEQGELKKTISFLNALCPDLADSVYNQIESHWQEHGLPDGVETLIVSLSTNPSHWRTILGIPEDGDAGGQDREPTSGSGVF